MSEIQDAKRTLFNLRADFEARKAREWEEVRTKAQVALDEAVWKARKSGKSVYAIAKEYGTTNRNTIYDILKRAENYQNLVAPAPNTETEPANYVLSDLDARTWLVTDSDTGRTVEVSKATRKPGANTGPEGTPALGLEMRKDPNHEAWKVVPK